MVRNRLCRVVLIFSLSLFIQLHYANSAIDNYFRYCKHGNLENQTQKTCRDGVNFGFAEDMQNCVCIKGIYKLYTDGCQEADGFAAEEVCTTLRDEEANSNSWSMRLAEVPAGFSWTSTAVACNKAPGAVWTLATKGAPITTKDDNFYAINGKAFIMPDSTFCIQKAQNSTTNICRYFKPENSGVWHNASQYSITLQDVCSGGTALTTTHCFSTMTSAESECTITCSKNPIVPPVDSGEEPLPISPTLKPGVTTKPTKPVTGGGGGGGSSGRQTTKKPKIQLTKADFEKNCTNPDDYRNHDNRFLNRKMLLYNVVNQLDMRKESDGNILDTMEPNKTLGLFNLMKNITKKVCPTEYVNNEWIDQAVDLFYILHKGNVFRYEEQLKPEQYQWIMDILTQCETESPPIVLTSLDPSDSGGECSGGASGLATGYCNSSSDDGSCSFVPVTVDRDGEDSYKHKHYVPEVAWNIVDAIHVACFPQFNQSYRMFHVLEQAVERLFTLQIKTLWHHPGWLEKTKTKLLGFGADNNMYNFDVCLQSAYGLRNEDVPRLVRPFSPVYLRKKRSVSKRKTDKVFIKKPSNGRKADPNPRHSSDSSEPTTSPKPPGRDNAIGCVKRPRDLRRPPNCQWPK